MSFSDINIFCILAFPQHKDPEEWDHVVNERISKLQILKPEKLRKNEVMQEIFHTSAMVPGNKFTENPLITIFRPLNTLSCRILLQFLMKSKGDLYSTWEHQSPLIFSENPSLASHPLLYWRSLSSRITTVWMLYPENLELQIQSWSFLIKYWVICTCSSTGGLGCLNILSLGIWSKRIIFIPLFLFSVFLLEEKILLCIFWCYLQLIYKLLLQMIRLSMFKE